MGITDPSPFTPTLASFPDLSICVETEQRWQPVSCSATRIHLQQVNVYLPLFNCMGGSWKVSDSHAKQWGKTSEAHKCFSTKIIVK